MSVKIVMESQVQWFSFIVPATLVSEAGGSLEPRSLGTMYKIKEHEQLHPHK
jgi:hypothetical protein